MAASERYRIIRALGVGSYAEVFRAEHRESAEAVAFKRAKRFTAAKDRIKREIEAQKQLAHPNVMPIFDHDETFSWYAMPLALGSLADLRKTLTEDDLETILLDVAAGLKVAHEQRLIHRDISPGNIFGMRTGTGSRLRWLVGDWGMVKHPPEMASRPLTRTGDRMGTPGFDAPELDVDPSAATPAADVFSLGRIAAWFVSGKPAQSAFPPLPDDEYIHWRPFVRACTFQEVGLRLQTVDDLEETLRQVSDNRDVPLHVQAARLIEGLLFGDVENLDALLSLAATHPEDFALYIDYVARIPTSQLPAWTAKHRERAANIATVMANHLISGPWDDRDPEYAATPLTFVLTVLRSLVDVQSLGLAQDAAPYYFTADAQRGDAGQRARTLEWLAELDEAAARPISRTMAPRPELVEYYREAGWHPRSVVLQALLTPAPSPADAVGNRGPVASQPTAVVE
ncbi:protein kinase domain-containing protein [Micromonospora wenchangensis]|uniref:protein kinase domain-containing protein n=1 Tax=Micromonospora wenchangensis TaxID=1185415 RepID=UPI001303F86A|nr:serine/threonine-protein kinase [Micromonospora wenchangensis]